MPEFHHPYNFIPVTGKVNGESTPKVLYEKIAEGYEGIRHDLWQQDTFSGRIVARVHLMTPTMVGETTNSFSRFQWGSIGRAV